MRLCFVCCANHLLRCVCYVMPGGYRDWATRGGGGGGAPSAKARRRGHRRGQRRRGVHVGGVGGVACGARPRASRRAAAWIMDAMPARPSPARASAPPPPRPSSYPRPPPPRAAAPARPAEAPPRFPAAAAAAAASCSRCCCCCCGSGGRGGRRRRRFRSPPAAEAAGGLEEEQPPRKGLEGYTQGRGAGEEVARVEEELPEVVGVPRPGPDARPAEGPRVVLLRRHRL